MTPIYPIYTSCKFIMSSRKSATTPAARRNPARAAKAPRAATDAPRRARIQPFGTQSGGSQAESHEAADVSGNDTSDGDSYIDWWPWRTSGAIQRTVPCAVHAWSRPLLLFSRASPKSQILHARLSGAGTAAGGPWWARRPTSEWREDSECQRREHSPERGAEPRREGDTGTGML